MLSYLSSPYHPLSICNHCLSVSISMIVYLSYSISSITSSHHILSSLLLLHSVDYDDYSYLDNVFLSPVYYITTSYSISLSSPIISYLSLFSSYYHHLSLSYIFHSNVVYHIHIYYQTVFSTFLYLLITTNISSDVHEYLIDQSQSSSSLLITISYHLIIQTTIQHSIIIIIILLH